MLIYKEVGPKRVFLPRIGLLTVCDTSPQALLLAGKEAGLNIVDDGSELAAPVAIGKLKPPKQTENAEGN